MSEPTPPCAHKRDWHLVRRILLGEVGYNNNSVFTPESQHVDMLKERGWVSWIASSHDTSNRPAILSPAGHDAAAMLQNEIFLINALAELEAAGIGATEELLFKLIRTYQDATLLLIPAFTGKVNRIPKPGDKIECITPGGIKRGNGIVIGRDSNPERIIAAWLRHNPGEDAHPSQLYFSDYVLVSDILKIEDATPTHLAELRSAIEANGMTHDLPPP